MYQNKNAIKGCKNVTTYFILAYSVYYAASGTWKLEISISRILTGMGQIIHTNCKQTDNSDITEGWRGLELGQIELGQIKINNLLMTLRV